MSQNLPTILGIGSVTPYGTIAGLIPAQHVEPTPIVAWTTDGLRRAFQVQPFEPSRVVPGVKTRRLDRLSAWTLVAASLALQDAGIDLEQCDRSRVAVVFATGFGCIELTEAFYRSARANGWAGTDPITFPETLANSPAGHVALFHNLRGPNITVSCGHFSGESALLQAASLLRHDQSDTVVVIAGDALAQTAYEWYDTAGLLSPACFSAATATTANDFVPSEGVVALVLASKEISTSSKRRAYARFLGGRTASAGEPFAPLHRMLQGSVIDLMIGAGNGAPCNIRPELDTARKLVGAEAAFVHPQPVACGLTDTGGLLHLVLALSSQQRSGRALMLGTSRNSGYAGLLFELP